MVKDKLQEIKKELLALGLVGVMFGTTGCVSNLDHSGIPKRISISSEYSNVEDYYKYVVQDGEVVKLYNSSNVYLLYDKETYDVSEYLYYATKVVGGLGNYIELYDLTSEEMLYFSSGISTTYNSDFYSYILDNNYQVCLADLSDYVEGYDIKDYYSLDEIKELEPLIKENLKKINAVKTKVKR